MNLRKAIIMSKTRNVMLDNKTAGRNMNVFDSSELSTREKAKILAMEWKAGDEREEKLAKELREEISAKKL